MGQGLGRHDQAVGVGDPGADLVDGDAPGSEFLGQGHAELLHRRLAGGVDPRRRQGPQRYGDLRRLIPEISDKLLTQRLRDLERDGLVLRQVTPARPPQVSYSFSDDGRTLIPVIQSLCVWGQLHGGRQGCGG